MFRELAHPRIVFLTRWTLPIGFFVGWAAYITLALLNRRARVIAIVVALVLIGGLAADHYGVLAMIKKRYKDYVANCQISSEAAKL